MISRTPVCVVGCDVRPCASLSDAVLQEIVELQGIFNK